MAVRHQFDRRIIYDPDGLAALDTTPAEPGLGSVQAALEQAGQSVKGQRQLLGTQPGLMPSPATSADANAMNAAMLSGDLDVISNLQAPDAIDQFNDTSRYTVIQGTTTGEVVMALNNARDSLKSVKVPGHLDGDRQESAARRCGTARAP